MRIYQITIEHTKYGRNWDSTKVAANTAEQAIRKAKRDFTSRERVESVELIAAVD